MGSDDDVSTKSLAIISGHLSTLMKGLDVAQESITMSRLHVIRAILRLDKWLMHSVSERANQRPQLPPTSWLDRLFDTVEANCLAGRPTNVTVLSEAYLPEITGSSYSFATNRSDTFTVTYHTRAAVRAFLGFACDHWSIAGANIVQDLVDELGDGVLLSNLPWALMTHASQWFCFQARPYEINSLNAVDKFMVEWRNQKSQHPLFTQGYTPEKDVLYQLRLLTSDVILDSSVVCLTYPLFD